jgi:DNA-binding transcriptional ArsR family regulator
MQNNKKNEDELKAIETQIFAEFGAGRRPDIDEYLSRHPDFEEQVVEMFWVAMSTVRLSDPPSEAEIESVHRLAEQSRSRATNLTERLRELSVTPRSLATALNVPVEVVHLMQKRCLIDLPEELLVRLSRFLRRSVDGVIEIVSAITQQPRLATHFRATGEPVAHAATIRRFDDVIRDLHTKGKLDNSQIDDWLEDAL